MRRLIAMALLGTMLTGCGGFQTALAAHVDVEPAGKIEAVKHPEGRRSGSTRVIDRHAEVGAGIDDGVVAGKDDDAECLTAFLMRPRRCSSGA